jgi:carboxyl-terminal processing protease
MSSQFVGSHPDVWSCFMPFATCRGRSGLLLACTTFLLVLSPHTWGQTKEAEVASAQALWTAAQKGDHAALAQAMRVLAQSPETALGSAAIRLREHIEQREETRRTRLAEVRADLEKALAEPQSDLSIAKALRAAIELHTLTPEPDKPAVLADPVIRDLKARAEHAAREAESSGSIIAAGELFVLLDLLSETSGSYKADVRRISLHQEMLRLYAPRRMWELRNERAKAEGNKPLPPYNPFGDDWKAKLQGIDQTLLERALAATHRHVEQKPMNELLLGGLDNLRVFVQSHELVETFPSLAQEGPRSEFLAAIEDAVVAVRAAPAQYDRVRVGTLIDRLRIANERTIRIPAAVLFHEFGQGCMSRLDEFSEIIWPDEVRRFNKNTQGRFVGVGIQIEYDEVQNIRVVSPLEGTPAQRAGIHPGDIIVKVDDQPIYGLSLDQAVDVITGPENTTVKLTIERKVDDPNAPDGKRIDTIDFSLRRAVINVVSVKGWRRDGVREDAWDWFIDRESGIAYVRLSQFSESTAREFDTAVNRLSRQGARGLIFDLRFNPGGHLDQAVRVAQRFLDVENGYIVLTRVAGGRNEQPEYTNPDRAQLARIPVIVLINEGSASASEIVAGAIATYARRGQADAIILGARSYGKGSVQNVWPITSNALLKLTTAYYLLPDETIVHRRPGATVWGVEPFLKVEMLPRQISDAFLLRRNADIIPLDENGAAQGREMQPNPDDLIRKGLDLQLETALVVLKGRLTADAAVAQRP